MFLLRIIVFLILISLIMILAYPLLIVFDISTGGNGFGVCEDLLTCTIPITAGPRSVSYTHLTLPTKLLV